MGKSTSTNTRLNAPVVAAFLSSVSSLLAGTPVSVAVVSAPRTELQGRCSAPVRIQTLDSSGNVANVRSNTTVHFTGTSTSLALFSDSLCSKPASTVNINGGTHSAKVYFEGSASGDQLLMLSTSSFGGAQQTETITGSGSGSGPAPPPPPPPSGSGARKIPSPVYGVTLDDVSNVTQEVASLQQLQRFPTARVVFDYSEKPAYYTSPLQKLRPAAYIMGEIADSSDMKKYTAASMQTRTQSYVSALGSLVDVWEVGNEINGNWLGTGAMSKMQAAYDTVSAAGGATAITFFYEGEPSDRNNCIAKNNGGDDMFSWINTNFQMNLPASQRSAETEKMRLGVNYALISWYPDQCNNMQPNWSTIFSQLSAIFPNAKTGFGEIGTANPQDGSSYETNLINQFYPLAKTTALPPS